MRRPLTPHQHNRPLGLSILVLMQWSISFVLMVWTIIDGLRALGHIQVLRSAHPAAGWLLFFTTLFILVACYLAWNGYGLWRLNPNAHRTALSINSLATLISAVSLAREGGIVLLLTFVFCGLSTGYLCLPHIHAVFGNQHP